MRDSAVALFEEQVGITAVIVEQLQGERFGLKRGVEPELRLKILQELTEECAQFIM